jgi:hypothetical protein
MTDEQKPATVFLGGAILITPGGKKVFLPPTTIPASGVHGHERLPALPAISTPAAADPGPGDDEATG